MLLQILCVWNSHLCKYYIFLTLELQPFVFASLKTLSDPERRFLSVIMSQNHDISRKRKLYSPLYSKQQHP